MINSRFSSMAFYFVAFAALLIPVFYYNNLPEQIASHFNASGRADSWMHKVNYFRTYYVLLLAMIFLFLGIIFLLKKLPESMINIPNKKYWFEPSRKKSAINAIKNFIYLLGVLVIFSITLLFLAVYRVNIDETYDLGNSLWFYMVIITTGTIFIVIKMYLHFNKIEKQ